MELLGVPIPRGHGPLDGGYLPVTDFTCVLGRNDVGKSSLLEEVRRALQRTGSDYRAFFCELGQEEFAALDWRRLHPWEEELWRDDPDALARSSCNSVQEWATETLKALSANVDERWERLTEPLLRSRCFAIARALDHLGGPAPTEWDQAFWCLPPSTEPALQALARELTWAEGAAMDPFAGLRGSTWADGAPMAPEAGWGWQQVLDRDGAPVPVLDLGVQQWDLPWLSLPAPIVLPATTSEVEHAAERAIEWLTRRIIGRDHKWLDERELWSVSAGEGASAVRPEVFAARDALQRIATKFLPDFVSRRYEVGFRMRAPIDWQEHQSKVRAEAYAQGDGDETATSFSLEGLAAGFQIWFHMAIFEAANWVTQIPVASPRYKGQPTTDMPRPSDIDLDEFELEPPLEGEALDQLVASSTSQRLRAMYLVDEPERHLHPALQWPAASHIAELAKTTASSFVVATHSPAFMRAGVESGQLIRIERRTGEPARVEPITSADLIALNPFTAELGLDHGELLALVDVFVYVEGLTDKVVLDTVFGEELRRAGVRVVPIHGWVKGLTATTQSMAVLAEFTTARHAIWLDNVRYAFIERMVQIPKAPAAVRNDPNGTKEEKALAQFAETARQKGRTIEPLANPMDDVLFLLDEEAVRDVYPTYRGHEHAHSVKASRSHPDRQLDWYASLVDNPKDTSAYRKIAEAMVTRGTTGHPALKDVVAQVCEIASQPRL